MDNQLLQQNRDPLGAPCPICGAHNFIWGRTVGTESAGSWVYFRREEGGWGDGEKLSARKCGNCNNVQLFTLMN